MTEHRTSSVYAASRVDIIATSAGIIHSYLFISIFIQMQVQNQKDVEIVTVMSYLIELQLSMK